MLFLDVQVPTAPDNPNPYPILHVVPQLVREYPDLAILVISMLIERSLISALMDAGVSGYILKNDRVAVQGLGSIVMSVAGGGAYLSEQARQQWLRRRIKDDSELILTARQLKVLSLCAAHPNWSRTELAEHLGATTSTARNTLHSAYLRLGVGTLAAAIAKARQLGVITPANPTTNG